MTKQIVGLMMFGLGMWIAGCGETPKPEVRSFVSQVNPAHVLTGKPFTLIGSELGTTGKVQIKGGPDLLVASWKPNEITVKTEETTPVGDHQIAVILSDGRELETVGLRVSPLPALLETVRPDAAKAGDAIVLKGKRFGEQKGSRLVVMGTPVTKIKSWTQNEISFELPAHEAGDGELTITLEGPTSKSNSLPFAYLRPRAERMVPEATLPGKLVTLLGKDFGDKPGKVMFGIPPVPGEVVKWADREISVRLPKDLDGQIQVRVSNENGAAIPLMVDILTPPTQGRIPAPLARSVAMALDPYDRPFLFTFDLTTMKLFLTQWTQRGWSTEPMIVRIGKTTAAMPKAAPDLEAKIQKVMDASAGKNKDQKELEKEVRAVVDAESKVTATQTEVAPAAGAFPSIVVDAQQRVRMTCFQMMNLKIIYGERSLEAPEWEFQMVVPNEGAKEGLFSANATDSKGLVHVAYMNANGNHVSHAVRKEGKFVPEVVDPDKDAGMAITMAIDSKDQLHLAYLDFGKFDLKYAVQEGGKWRVDRIEEQGWTGDMPSLVIDEKDNPIIAFYKRDDQGLIPMSVRLATRVNGKWNVETVEEGPGVGLAPVLRRDSKGRLHLVYQDNKSKGLRYAVREAAGGAWKKTTIPTPEIKTDIEPARFSTAIGTDDLLRLAYWTEKELQFKVLSLP